ncbi:MAG TPA: NUDIX hydrolase [Terriglobia bacterium]|nr:NUDIX hydrolase [Terriglobia bacterium]
MKSLSVLQISRPLVKQRKNSPRASSLDTPGGGDLRREYPDRPVLAVGGVVVKDGSVLLIRRGRAPSLGEWSLPGGMVEVGERVRAAVRRELKEETGLSVEPVALAAVFERILRRGGRVRYHYTVLDYACRLRGGRLRHGSDVTDARWVRHDELNRYHLRRTAQTVIRRSFEILETQPGRRAFAKMQARTDRMFRERGKAVI